MVGKRPQMFAETKQEQSQTLLPNLLNTFVVEDLVSQLGATGISIEIVGVTVISNRAPVLSLGVGLFQLGFSVICGDQHSTYRWKKKKKKIRKIPLTRLSHGNCDHKMVARQKNVART